MQNYFGKKPRPVNKINLKTKKIIKTYPSVREASNEFEEMYARIGITSCCQHRQRSAYGYGWEYAD